MFYYMQGKTAKTVYITADVTDVDLFTLFGSPTTPRTFQLVINSGVLVRATTTANAAIYASQNFPSGSILKINNLGCIHGMGGNTASSYSTIENPFVSGAVGLLGLVGGSSIKLPCKTYISTSSGYIFGGGGSGAGACLITGFHPQLGYAWGACVGGGGSGGGIANNIPRFGISGFYLFQVVSGTNGTYGTAGTYGIGGSNTYNPYNVRAGSGGSYGQNGESLIVDMSQDVSFPGGLAGKAVDINSFELTFLSGLDANHVKGAYN